MIMANRKFYQWKCMTIWDTLVFFTIYQIYMTDSRGIFQTRIISITNPNNILKSGRCCGTRNLPQQGSRCSAECNTYASVCLAFRSGSISSCSIGTRTSSVIGGSTIPSNETVPNRLIEVLFTFSWQGHFAFRLKVMDKDRTISPSDADLIDDVILSNTISPNTTWIQKRHTGSVATIYFKYRLVCSTNYYGAQCNKVCRPRDDQFGHSTCDDQGNKVCLAGWSGRYCTTATCRQTCINGQCQSPNSCGCNRGWSGYTCSTCIKRAGCLYGHCVRPFECWCQTGWQGTLCNQRTDYCASYSPCMNNAICHNTGLGQYRCQCQSGFTGTNCETKLSPCSSNPCQNGGACRENSANFVCVCPNRFTGRLCESKVNKCLSVVCQNNGTCLDVNGTATCRCLAEFYGRHCETMRTSTPGILTLISSTVIKITPTPSSPYLQNTSILYSTLGAIRNSSKRTFTYSPSISSSMQSSMSTYLSVLSYSRDIHQQISSFTSLSPSVVHMVPSIRNYQNETISASSSSRSSSQNTPGISNILSVTSSDFVTQKSWTSTNANYSTLHLKNISNSFPITSTVANLNTIAKNITSKIVGVSIFPSTVSFSTRCSSQNTPRISNMAIISSAFITQKSWTSTSANYSTLHVKNISYSFSFTPTIASLNTFTKNITSKVDQVSIFPSTSYVFPLAANSTSPTSRKQNNSSRANFSRSRMAIAFSATLSVIILGVILLLFLWRRARKRRMNMNMHGTSLSSSFTAPHGLFYSHTGSSEKPNRSESSSNATIVNNNRTDIQLDCQKTGSTRTLTMFSNIGFPERERFSERDLQTFVVYENQRHIERTDVDHANNGYTSDGSSGDYSSGYSSQNSSARSSANSNSKSRPKSFLSPQDIYALSTPKGRRKAASTNFEELPNYVMCKEESL